MKTWCTLPTAEEDRRNRLEYCRIQIVKLAEPHLDELRTIINYIPQHGDKADSCQKMALLQALGELENTFNGLEAGDMDSV